MKQKSIIKLKMNTKNINSIICENNNAKFILCRFISCITCKIDDRIPGTYLHVKVIIVKVDTDGWFSADTNLFTIFTFRLFYLFNKAFSFSEELLRFLFSFWNKFLVRPTAMVRSFFYRLWSANESELKTTLRVNLT